MTTTRSRESSTRRAITFAPLLIAVALFASACAGLSRAPETGRPRANEPAYPVVLEASEERRERSLAAWSKLTGEQGATQVSTPELQPVTATLSALPSDAPGGDASGAPFLLRLPQVGGVEGREPTADEMRESLRRFVASASPLLGVAPEELSLAEHRDVGATRVARYQQKPFAHPLRGGYGVVEIVYAPDRRVLSLTSTAIPEAERVARALAAVTPQLAQKDVAARIANSAVTFAGEGGAAAQTVMVGASDEITVRELVVYPARGSDTSSTLAFRLAWEVSISRPGGAFLVYVDAVGGEVIAAVARPGVAVDLVP